MRPKNLASERVRIGYTQEMLANEIGVSVTSLFSYENFKKPIPQEALVKAANLFGCSTDYLLGRTEERLPR